MTFLVLKSYDGGRTWEAARRCADFAAAAHAAEALRSQHPMIRFRLDVETSPQPARRRARAKRSRQGRRNRSLLAHK